MIKRDKHMKFYISAVWDDEAKVYVSESNIRGLHIIAESIEEFEEVMEDLAFDLIMANHIAPKKLDSKPIREFFPNLTFRIPQIRAPQKGLAALV